MTIRSIGMFLSAWLSLSASLYAAPGGPVREGAEIIAGGGRGIGQLAADVAFTDLSGKEGSLGQYRGKVLVVAMHMAGCPVGTRYIPRLEEISRQYSDRGVAFLAVNSTQAIPRSALARAGKMFGEKFRFVHDPSGAIAGALGATSSTELFVIDGGRTLVYRGAVDDQFGLGFALPEPRQNFAIAAIEAALKGESPMIAATTAPGCVLETKVAPASGEITWHSRVSRIVQNNCQECHRPGEPAPFSLLEYADAKSRARTIGRVVERGIMPPWFAQGEHGTWENDSRLTESEKKDLLAWIEAGAPEGHPADAPLPRKWIEGWRIGQPDAVFEAKRENAIPATGTVPYIYTTIQTQLDEDKWVRAIEVRPTAPTVVHHILVFIKYPEDHPRRGEQPRFQGGLTGYFAGMVPGAGVSTFPERTAKFLPRGAELILQIHYTPDGTATTDRPRIGLLFTGKPEHEVVTRSAFSNRFLIPPGASDFPISGAYTFKSASRITTFSPHAHVRAKAFKYWLEYPDGRKDLVLDIPQYDFNWQLEYRLSRPIDVPAGTKLSVTGWYDNSEANPANPDPKRAVPFGEQTTDEMMIGYFTAHPIPDAK